MTMVAPAADMVLRSGGNARANLVYGRRVLVVDDEESIRVVIAALLEALGVIVTVAENGSQALELYRRETFDAVLTDYHMPQMRGDELACAIKNVNPAQRVLLITGSAEDLREQGKLPAGIDEMIAKPCTLDQLAHALSDIPRQKSAAPSQNYLAA